MGDSEQNSSASIATETPAGAGDYVVSQGECISSIAYEHGQLLETILNHPDNQELKRARKDYHILLPGDRVTIPPAREKRVSADTDKRHKFRLTRATEIFQIRLLDIADQPRANLRYKLIIDHMTFSGTTDQQGALKHSIPPNARRGRLILGKGKNREEIELNLGNLNPVDTISGAQARLKNLGLDCGAVDGILGPKTRNALERFQKANNLEQTGELDSATIGALEAKYGS